MDLEARIQKAKQKGIQAVQDAARRGDISSVVAISRELEQIEAVLKRKEALMEEARRLLDVLDGKSVTPPAVDENLGPSQKAKGRAMRERFIAECEKRGIRTERIRGQIWRVSGKTVVIAYASERPSRPNRWFLGVPVGEYDAVVLICEDSDQKVTTFVIPREFYEQHRNNISRDSGGQQLKLNVAEANGRYSIVIPGEGTFTINPYIDAIECLGSSR